MNVLIVSQYFKPESFRINEVANSLNGKVERLTVLTGQPNYPEGLVFTGYRSTSSSRRIEDGIDVVRVPILPRGSSSPTRLFLNYFSFVLSALFFGFFRLRKDSYNVVFCYAPSPILQALPGIFLSWWFNAPFVFHVQDLWPQSLSSTGYVKSKLVLSFVRSVVKFIYSRCDLILVSSRPFESDIRTYCPNGNIAYLPNSVDSSFYSSDSSQISNDPYDNGFSVVFAGNIGSAQSVNTILEASELLLNHSDISIYVYGSGSELSYMQSVKLQKNLSNLKLMGRVPSSEMPSLLSSASCLLVTLKDTEIFRMTVPNKVQAYLAVGRPIIACMAGEGSRIISEADAGMVCEAENPVQLAKTILKMKSLDASVLATMGSNGRAYFLRNFEHGKLMNDLMCHFQAAIKNK